MNKLLTTITLLCFSVVSLAETRVCSFDGREGLLTFERTDSGFQQTQSDNGGVDEFSIYEETETYLVIGRFIPRADISEESFFFEAITINKVTGSVNRGSYNERTANYDVSTTLKGTCVEV
jgi:hypothetical protein